MRKGGKWSCPTEAVHFHHPNVQRVYVCVFVDAGHIRVGGATLSPPAGPTHVVAGGQLFITAHTSPMRERTGQDIDTDVFNTHT